jgi:mycofactocin system FadH/OYE family oxidoreductase 2
VAVSASAALLEPLGLAGVMARNRIVFAPHCTNLSEGGLPGERLAAYFERRASGGVGVIVLEEAQVHPSSHPYQRAIRGYDPAIRGAWRRLGDRLHAGGAIVIAQLSHCGMQGTGHILKRALWAPSAVPNPATLEMPKVMEPEDIAAIVEGFGRAARWAAQAGLDGVELNAGQHSLLRQFMSGLTNQRTDGYGGGQEERARLLREVIAAARRELGTGFVLGLRLCGDELAPWAGITPEQAPELAAGLAGLVDYLSVVTGSIYSVEATRAGLHQPPGYALELAAAVRGAVDGLPVFASGSLVDPEQASAAIAAGKADACEMTRALIADPDLPRKLEHGARHRIRPCIRCNQDCMVRSASNAAVSCLHNPEAGYESQWPAPAPASRARRVLVVGGGPAGMEAARIASVRGHRVTLVERSQELGGTPRMVAASGQRETLGLVAAWLSARLAELPVEVRLGVEATPALPAELGAETVVLATGGRARPPHDLPGGQLGSVVSVRDLLGGRLPGRGRVAIIDRQGSYPAIDAARFTAERGRPVTILTEDAFVSGQLGASGELMPWHRAAAALEIQFRTLVTVLKIESGGLRLRQRFGAEESFLEADCVVVADHELAEDSLYHRLREGCPELEVRRAGDCLAPRRVLQAVLEGGHAGREV